MTTLRQTKLYPTPANCQLTDDTGPALQKLEHAIDLIKALPAEEQASATVTGWFGLRIDYARRISAEQLRDEQLSMLRSIIEQAAAGDKGMTDEELERILVNLRAIRTGT